MHAHISAGFGGNCPNLHPVTAETFQGSLSLDPTSDRHSMASSLDLGGGALSFTPPENFYRVGFLAPGNPYSSLHASNWPVIIWTPGTI